MMKKGYVLPTTLMIISIAIALLTSVMSRSFLYQDTVSFELKKQRVRMLAFSGIQIAMAQASLVLPEDKKSDADSKAKSAEAAAKSQNAQKTSEQLTPAQQHIVQLLPIVNKWQTFKLNENADGIDGTIQIYISCENGKFNLTRMSELLTVKDATGEKNQKTQEANKKEEASKKQATAGPVKTWPETVSQLLEQAGIAGFSKTLISFKEKNGRAPDDPTELLTQEAIKAFKTNIFLSQPEKSILKSPIYLMDLFTTATSTERLNPWLLSASVATLLGFKRNSEKFNVKEKIKEVRPFTNWSQQWNKLLEPLYGKKFEAIQKEITPLFAASFDASVCSVTCYAQIQNATQKIYAIIEKVNPPTGISSKSVVFKIKRLYWL